MTNEDQEPRVSTLERGLPGGAAIVALLSVLLGMYVAAAAQLLALVLIVVAALSLEASPPARAVSRA